jgi:hypothetical protein
MAATIDMIKEKINGVLAKYPVIDEPLAKVATNLKTEKAYIVIGILLAVPVIIFSLVSGGSLLMYDDFSSLYIFFLFHALYLLYLCSFCIQ